MSKRWARNFDRCVRCGTTDRRHEARGYCLRCYDNVTYHENIEREHRERKLRRLRAPIEKAQADYEREKRWKAANRERALARQKAHYERNKHLLNKWPIGGTVWYHLHGLVWCKATIVQRINRLRILVELSDGSRHEAGLHKAENVRRDRPIEAEVAA